MTRGELVPLLPRTNGRTSGVLGFAGRVCDCLGSRRQHPSIPVFRKQLLSHIWYRYEISKHNSEARGLSFTMYVVRCSTADN